MMRNVQGIYLSKLNQIQSRIDAKMARLQNASTAFSDYFNIVDSTQSVIDGYQSLSFNGSNAYDFNQNTYVSSGSDIDTVINNAAIAQGMDPMLIRAVVQVESSFRPDAVSGAGAQGLMQLMPGTAKELGVTDPFDPSQNVNGGTTYLKKQIERFGDVRLALAAYNTGPGRIASLNISDPDNPSEYAKISERVRGYVEKVMTYYNQYTGGQ